MQPLRIRLFGGLQVQIGDKNLSSKIGPAAGALLAYLAAYHERLHRREGLATVFWPDLEPENGRRCLNTTLWRLRKLLECYPARKGTYLASTAQGEIGLATSDNVWIDIKYFEERKNIGARSSMGCAANRISFGTHNAVIRSMVRKTSSVSYDGSTKFKCS